MGTFFKEQQEEVGTNLAGIGKKTGYINKLNKHNILRKVILIN